MSNCYRQSDTFGFNSYYSRDWWYISDNRDYTAAIISGGYNVEILIKNQLSFILLGNVSVIYTKIEAVNGYNSNTSNEPFERYKLSNSDLILGIRYYF